MMSQAKLSSHMILCAAQQDCHECADQPCAFVITLTDDPFHGDLRTGVVLRMGRGGVVRNSSYVSVSVFP